MDFSSKNFNLSSSAALNWYQEGAFAQLKGLDIFYRIEGKGEPLVIIHGFPTSSLDFDAIWPSLTKRFKVMIHDLVGLGCSDKPKSPITVGLQADIIEQLAIENGFNSAHILSHDYGDTVAQELLARQLDGHSSIQWKSCILLNGGLFPEAYRPRFIQKLLISPLGSLIAQFTSKNTLKGTMDNIFSKAHPPSEEFIDSAWEIMVLNNGKAAIPRVIRYMAERKKNAARWTRALAEADVPLRLINGVEDPISGGHVADFYEKVIPEPDIVRLKNVGHYPQIEVPEVVLKAIFEFHQ